MTLSSELNIVPKRGAAEMNSWADRDSTLLSCTWMESLRVLGQSDIISRTLPVKKRASICGFLRGCLGDGSQEGTVALQNGCHEAQKGFLDLQLHGVETLPTAQL